MFMYQPPDLPLIRGERVLITRLVIFEDDAL
jgi:hypothetical protein